MSAPPEGDAAPIPSPAPAPARVRLPSWLLPALIALAIAAQLIAFRWGVILPDTVVQYAQVRSGHYADWHPPAMAWLWRTIGGARFGSAPFLLLDVALYWLGLGLVADALRRRGHRALALAPLLLGLMPIPFGQMGAILKDSLLAACLLAATGIAGRSLLRDRAMPWPARLAVALLALFAAAVRINAALAAAPLLLLALPHPPRRLVPTLLLGLPLAIAAGLAANMLVNHVLLAAERQHPLLSQINLDLAGISVMSGHNAYPAAARPPMTLLAACYTPAQYNAHNLPACGTAEEGLHTLYDEHDGAVALWLGAIVRHPLAYARHRLAHLDANQRWLVRSVPGDAFYLMSAANDLGLAFAPNAVTTTVYRAATWLAWSPLGRPATWLAVAAALLLLPGAGATAAMARLLALSALLYGGGYAVASVAPDLRYNLWTMLAAALALILALAERPPWPRRRIALAALLPALAVAGELAALLAG